MSDEKQHSGETTGTAIDRGRQALGAWEAAQPDNYFSADGNLRRLLEMFWGTERLKAVAPQFYHFGRAAATVVDRAACEADLRPNLPELNRFDRFGRRLEDVTFHPSYHEAGRYIYASGLLSVYETAGQNLLALALFYISSQNGEAGHNCPIACTAGAIKALQAVGAPALREAFLPPLLDPDYDTNFHAAQFLTEVQGGSDVGANATAAAPLDPETGTWLIRGEKWFCSNVTADVILLTARVPSGGEGTPGLGLFLVPRLRPDGSLNAYSINRLKDKLGTRAMASGEVLFEDALAYQVGAVREGFKTVMTYVINTSRLYNALGTAGNARRAYLVASTYAEHRHAFGRPIVHFPVTQDLLARMRADTCAILGGSLRLAHVLDRAEGGEAEPDDGGFLRLALNLNKMRSAMLAHEVVVTGIELLGGNGAIENFSVLPRLLRDNGVYENWEGTHNVLLAQIGRDMRRYGVHKPFLRRLRGWLEGAVAAGELRAQVLESLDGMAAELDEVLAMDELTAGIFMRPLMIRLADLYYAACLALEASWELSEKQDRTKERLALLFLQRRALALEPKSIPYYDDLVARVALER
jgi:alkylation response protein AidB-like acyl-CoA dehydrogenase